MPRRTHPHSPAPLGRPLTQAQVQPRWAAPASPRMRVFNLILFVLTGAASGVAQPVAAAAPGCAERPALAAHAAPGDFVAAVARNAPAVVHLLTVRERSEDAPPIDYENVFPMQGGASAQAPGEGAGLVLERVTASGFFISPDGEILTSAHAVLGRSEVWAVLADGRHLPVRLIGVDRRTDVALVKVAAQGLPVVRTAPEAPVCAGQWVAALGAPFGFERSVTAGVVSAGPRALFGGSDTALIQMNVALNPGSSGGPLFNSAGEVVGMNAMIYASEGFFVGISFALPIGAALQGVARVRAGALRPLATLPARTQALRPDLARAFGLAQPDGVLIAGDDTITGPQGGLHRGDVLLMLDGRPVPDREALDRVLSDHAPGAVLPARVWRSGRDQGLTVRLGQTIPERFGAAPAPVPRNSLLGLRLVGAEQSQRWPPGAYVDTASGTGLLAGLDSGDRIIAVNGTTVGNPAEFEAAVRAATADVVALLVVRGPVTLYVPVARDASR